MTYLRIRLPLIFQSPYTLTGHLIRCNVQLRVNTNSNVIQSHCGHSNTFEDWRLVEVQSEHQEGEERDFRHAWLVVDWLVWVFYKPQIINVINQIKMKWLFYHQNDLNIGVYDTYLTLSRVSNSLTHFVFPSWHVHSFILLPSWVRHCLNWESNSIKTIMARLQTAVNCQTFSVHSRLNRPPTGALEPKTWSQ